MLDVLKNMDWKSQSGSLADMLDRWSKATQEITVAIVGKYVHLTDTYKSLNEALHLVQLRLFCKTSLLFGS